MKPEDIIQMIVEDPSVFTALEQQLAEVKKFRDIYQSKFVDAVKAINEARDLFDGMKEIGAIEWNNRRLAWLKNNNKKQDVAINDE